MISHLLDTCAFLDLIAERWKNRDAIHAFRASKNPALLSVSLWEIARKLRKGRLELPCSQKELLTFCQEVCEHFRIEIIPLDAETCCEAERLPALHEDPFDRMILARATLSNCPVFTSDRKFETYPVHIIWHRQPL